MEGFSNSRVEDGIAAATEAMDSTVAFAEKDTLIFLWLNWAWVEQGEPSLAREWMG